MERYYFTFGMNPHYLFEGGWVEIQAPNIQAAAQIFKAYYPNPEDSETLNCADYYTEDQFARSGMHNGNLGAKCHLVIGPQLENKTKTNFEHVIQDHKTLADALCNADFCGFCQYEKDDVCHFVLDCPNGRVYDGCVQAALKWLKSPYHATEAAND